MLMNPSHGQSESLETLKKCRFRQKNNIELYPLNISEIFIQNLNFLTVPIFIYFLFLE